MPVSQEYRIIGIESNDFCLFQLFPITNKRKREAVPRNKAGGDGKLNFDSFFFYLALYKYTLTKKKSTCCKTR